MTIAEEKYIIIRMEGGFCSQINYLGLGLYFQNKGYKVKYDLEWYKLRGVSNDGRHERNFDVLKAFPYIKCDIADEDEAKYYKTNYKYNYKDSISECIPPAYVSGFPKERILHFNQRNYFTENLNPIDSKDVEDIKTRILSSKSCGVHVRRGDLSGYHAAYGYPTPVEYYIKSIKLINGLSNNIKFYFFSDECNWVKDEIIPRIGSEINYEICDKNGSDKGYLDLYLMTYCDYLISSGGSLARFAKKISKKNPMIVLDRFDSSLINYYDNVLMLNDTILINIKNGK